LLCTPDLLRAGRLFLLVSKAHGTRVAGLHNFDRSPNLDAAFRLSVKSVAQISGKSRVLSRPDRRLCITVRKRALVSATMVVHGRACGHVDPNIRLATCLGVDQVLSHRLHACSTPVRYVTATSEYLISEAIAYLITAVGFREQHTLPLSEVTRKCIWALQISIITTNYQGHHRSSSLLSVTMERGPVKGTRKTQAGTQFALCGKALSVTELARPLARMPVGCSMELRAPPHPQQGFSAFQGFLEPSTN